MEPRDDLAEELQSAARQAFRGRKTGTTFETTGRFHLLSGIGRFGETLDKVPIALPYGFDSSAPTADETELVYLETDSGLIVVAERTSMPTGLTQAASGESQQYGNDGQYVKCESGGHIVEEPKTGKYVKLGSGASKSLVLNGDRVNKDTSNPGSDFATWMAQVEAQIIVGGGGQVVPNAANVIRIGTCVGTSSKSRGE